MDVIEACRAVLTVGGYRKLMEWYPDDGLQRAVSLALIMIEERPVKPKISNALKRYRPTSILDLHSEDILRPPDQPKPFGTRKREPETNDSYRCRSGASAPPSFGRPAA